MSRVTRCISCSPQSKIWQRPTGFWSAIDLHDLPEKIAIDKSGANTAALESINADACVDIPSNTFLASVNEYFERAEADRMY